MNEQEIRTALAKLTGWMIHKGRLEKTYTFANFARAAIFFNKIINPIEEQQHYPQIFIAYNRVVISLLTPEEGKLTSKDFILAAEIEKLT